MDGDNSVAEKCISSEVPFNDFSIMCEKISKTQGKENKKKLLQKFIAHWRTAHQKMHGTDKTTDSFFPGMRLLLPHLDKERAAYGVKEVVLAKYYIEALGLAKDSSDAQKLLNYRAPSSAKKEAGDFASVAYIVLKSRCPKKGSMTIQDINDSLDSIAQANIEKERNTAKNVMHKVIRNTSALEQKWFIRVMLKEMKFGLNENSIFPLFHKDALELFNVCNSLSKVCIDLHDKKTELNETEISLSTPFRPMLGQRVVIDEVIRLMANRDFIIETKIDGERMQLHKDDQEFRYFSRNSNDYSENFGMTKYRGTLTPFIEHLFKADIKTCILDGEMVGFDPQLGDFVLKGSNIDVKSDHLTDVQPCFVVFDVLMINGDNLANVPLQQRIQKMESLFNVERGRLQIVDRKIGHTKEDVIKAINDAVDKREEGIVIKDPSSTYKPSKRKGSGWLKLKPEYVDSLGDDLDLIILGGQYGCGHRGGMISHFLLGVAVTPEQNGDRPSQFMTFGKVGSGYTDKELKSICDQLNPYWKKFENPPPSILFTDGLKEKPDVIIDPKNSIIVQIKASEIQPSDKYRCQCTMRFPRMERVRDDKSWFECMTIDEVNDMRKMADGRLSVRQAGNDDGSNSEPSKKKRRTVQRVERPRAVAKHLKGADVSQVEELSNWLNNKEFCVINGTLDFSKQALEKKITENGGTFVQNPTNETTCIIVDKLNVRAKNVMRRENMDVVKAIWLIQCLDQGKLLPYQPSDLWFATIETKKSFSLVFDKYGDHFTEDIDAEKLKEIFADISTEEMKIETKNILNIEQRYFSDSSKLGLFRQCRLFNCQSTEVENYDKELLKTFSLEYSFHGGNMVESIDEASHVLVHERDFNGMRELKDKFKMMRAKPHIVTGQWIRECIDQQKTVEERPYQPLLI